MGMEALARWVYRRLIRPQARNSLRAALLLTVHGPKPSPVESFSAARVVVFAPHQDDEAIGCGGTLLQHLRAGAKVTVVYLTDGSLGDAALLDGSVPRGDRESRRRRLAALRREEARTYAARTGVQRQVFLDAPDGALHPEPPLVAAVAQIVRDEQPDIVYLPSALDSHEDHWQTNLVACAVLALLPERMTAALLLRGYEVWTPVVANLLADISEVMEEKLACLAVYASQLDGTDYVRSIRGLNAYRAMSLPARHGYAEAFVQHSVAEYRQFIDRLLA